VNRKKTLVKNRSKNEMKSKTISEAKKKPSLGAKAFNRNSEILKHS